MTLRSSNTPNRTALRVSDLSQAGPTAFDLRPDQSTLEAIAAELELSALRKLSFAGRIIPQGKTDWRLEGKLGATVVQPCVVTLQPVTTRIDVPVTRLFVADYEIPDEPEVEMTEDDTIEPLGVSIDPAAVMREALALEVPDYPRKDQAELGQMILTEPGTAPMTDEDARPFAGLAGLRDKLEKDTD